MHYFSALSNYPFDSVFHTKLQSHYTVFFLYPALPCINAICNSHSTGMVDFTLNSNLQQSFESKTLLVKSNRGDSSPI